MHAFRLWEEDRNPSRHRQMLHIKTIAGNCLAVTWHCWPLHHCAARFQISHLWEGTLRHLYNSFHEVHYCIYHHSEFLAFTISLFCEPSKTQQEPVCVAAWGMCWEHRQFLWCPEGLLRTLTLLKPQFFFTSPTLHWCNSWRLVTPNQNYLTFSRLLQNIMFRSE